MDENGMIIESTPDGEWTYDPNEPRYCICNQVSYGDMVACDNDVVSRRRGGELWFFLAAQEEWKFNGTIYVFPLPVSLRMVPLSVRWYNAIAKGQMVLPAMYVLDEATGIPPAVM